MCVTLSADATVAVVVVCICLCCSFVEEIIRVLSSREPQRSSITSTTTSSSSSSSSSLSPPPYVSDLKEENLEDTDTDSITATTHFSSSSSLASLATLSPSPPPPSSSPPPPPPAAAQSEVKDLTQRLCALGFMEKDAVMGATKIMERTGGGGGGGIGKGELNAALDWLCLNIPEHRLPKQFDPRGKQLEVVANKVSRLLLLPSSSSCLPLLSDVADGVVVDAVDSA